MNFLHLALHPKARHHRVLILRDKSTGRDIGQPKPLSLGDELKIDFDQYPDDVVVVIETGEAAEQQPVVEQATAEDHAAPVTDATGGVPLEDIHDAFAAKAEEPVPVAEVEKTEEAAV